MEFPHKTQSHIARRGAGHRFDRQSRILIQLPQGDLPEKPMGTSMAKGKTPKPWITQTGGTGERILDD
jgi:hypothetical protein